MPALRFLSSLFLSFYSADFYRDVALKWKGRGLKHIATLVLLAVLAIGYGWHQLIQKQDSSYYANGLYALLFGNPDYTTEQELNRVFYVLASLPEMSIEDGVLQTSAKGAVSIADPDTDPEATLVQINPELTAPPKEGTDIPLLIGQNFFLVTTGKSRPVIIPFGTTLENVQWNIVLHMASHFPHFSIKDGVAKMKESSPFTIFSYFNDKQPLITFDISGSRNTKTTAWLTFLRDRVEFKDPRSDELTSTAYRDLDEQGIKDILTRMIESAKDLLISGMFLILPILWLIWFSLIAAIAALLAVVGRTMARYLRIFHLTYIDIQRLSALSFTPVLIMKTMLPAFTLDGLVYFIIALYYLYFAIKANKTLVA